MPLPKITGLLCDTHHPFPAPQPPGEFLDSLEYGALERRSREHGMWDVDPTPIYRVVASEVWGTDCHEQHVRQVADDLVLLAHLLWTAVWVGAPRQPLLDVLAINHLGAGEAFKILHDHGLGSALAAARTIPENSRKELVHQLFAITWYNYLPLLGKIDVGMHEVKGVHLLRDR